MKRKDIFMLLVLSALWGASFLFIRIGAPSLGPFVLIEVRVLLAAVTLILLVIVRKQRIHILHKWWQYLVLGAINAAIPFTLISFAELHLDAGLAAILNAMTPMFTALIAWMWVKEPFSLKKLSGAVLGIIGVGVLVGWSSGAHEGGLWIPVSFSLVATIFYGIAGVYSSRHFKGEKPLDMAIGQQLAASLVLLPFGLTTMPAKFPSPIVILSVLGLAILCTAVAYLFYFSLIHSVGAVKTLTVTLLVPVFGVIWGRLFLGESITLRLVLGLFIILSSMALITNINFRFMNRTPASDPVEKAKHRSI